MKNTINLNILERLVLLNVLPPTGRLVTMRVVADLRHDLGLTDQEVTELGVRQVEAGGVRWNENAREHPLWQRDVLIGTAAYDLIRKALQDLDEAEGVQPDHLPLFEKFGLMD